MSVKEVKLKNAKIYFSALLLFAAGFGLGYMSWQGQVYVKLAPKKGRFLANYEGDQHLSLSLNEYRNRFYRALFEEASKKEDARFVEFSLGNFLIKNQEGHQLICQAYSHVELYFSALDISLSGDPSEMIIEAPCYGESVIGPFVLDKSKFTQNPSQSVFEFKNPDLLVRFYNTALYLTDKWLLKRVRFFNEGTNVDELWVSYPADSQVPSFEISLK